MYGKDYCSKWGRYKCQKCDDLQNTFDDTPLSLSVMNGHAEVVEYLLTMNVDVNTKDVEILINNTFTPLFMKLY